MEKNRSIGILDRGKNTKLKNNSFHGFDVAIQSEGEGLQAEGNIFAGARKNVVNWSDKWYIKSILTIISGLILAFLVYKLGLN